MKVSTAKLRFIAILLGLFIIILSIIAFIKIEKVKDENASLAQQVKKLEFQLTIKDMELKDVHAELTGLYQQVEQQQLELMGSSEYKNDIEYKYLITKSYANMAEYIINNLGVEFRQIDWK